MKLSIVILNYNTADLLVKCVDSVMGERGKMGEKGERGEIIVVDNGSTEPAFASPNRRASARQAKIKYIYNEQNYGFAKGNNIGIKQTTGEYVLLLNPDTEIPEQGKGLSQLIDFMDKNPQIGIMTCRVELLNGNLDDSCHRGFPTPWNAFCYFSGLSKVFSKNKLFAGYNLTYLNVKTIHEVDAVNGAFMLIRRKCGEELNWLDEDYFWYGEDLDFCYRAKQKGWKVFFWPMMKIIHYKGVASGIKGGDTTASRETKIKATEARFTVMKTFYDKHYKNKYPSWIVAAVLLSIELKKKWEMAKI